MPVFFSQPAGEGKVTPLKCFVIVNGMSTNYFIASPGEQVTASCYLGGVMASRDEPIVKTANGETIPAEYVHDKFSFTATFTMPNESVEIGIEDVSDNEVIV